MDRIPSMTTHLFVVVLLLILVSGLPVQAQPSPLPTTQDSGWQAFEQNDIAAAHEWANQALAQDAANQRARHLRILTLFLSGHFEGALVDYAMLPDDYSGRNETLSQLILDAYLHLDRYADAATFARTMETPEPELAWFDERAAYTPTVELDGSTVVPFVADNFLGDLMPAVEVEFNGTPLVAHLDTGGDFIVMASSRARELGVQTRPVGSGVANNQRTPVSRGLADSLVLGDARFTHVPVATVESLTGQLETLVILGTRILSRFLMTWDNEHGRLILTARDDPVARSQHLANHTTDIEGVDFYLHSDHYLWVHGTVAGHEALMFLDTGLVTLDPSGHQPAGAIHASMLDAWNITHAEGFTGPLLVSVGSGNREVSSFSVFPDRRNLPRLESTGPDILLSHGFLKHFVWTLDFDDYKLYLKPIPPSSVD